DALLHELPVRRLDAPLRIGNGFAALARDELEADAAGGVRDRRLGELAGLDRDVGADRGVGVAVGGHDLVDAGVQADYDTGLRVGHDGGAVGELVAVVGIDIVGDGVRLGGVLAEKRSDAQAAGVQYKLLGQRAAILDA